jgi:hypothetical protein
VSPAQTAISTEQEPEAETDPERAEDGGADRRGRRRACLRHRLQHEREEQGGHRAAEHPLDARHLCAHEGERGADVAGERERCERARHQPVLVQRDACGEPEHREQPPAAEVHGAEHDRQEHDRDDDAGQPVAHRPPNLRRLLA